MNRYAVLRERMPEASKKLILDFKAFFSNNGYTEHKPVLISSRIDKSVRFIGSHISVLKPYLLENIIPESGYFIAQDSIRSRNLKIMKDGSRDIEWGSFFCNFGALVQPESLERLCVDSFSFFQEVLEYDDDSMRIRVTSRDSDLLSICLDNFRNDIIEIDTFQHPYYNHEYGMDNVYGRNFNIALQNKEDGSFADVGNVIVIENSGKVLAAEVGFGNSTILKQMYNLNHVLDIYDIQGLNGVNEINRRKIEDCILVTTALFRENLNTKGKGCSQSFRRYLKALDFLCSIENISMESLRNTMNNYEVSEYGNSTSVGDQAILKIEEHNGD